MPNDDWRDQRDPHVQRLIDHSDDLSSRSDRVIERMDRASRNLRQLLPTGSTETPEAAPNTLEWTITHEDSPGLTVVRARGDLTAEGCRKGLAELTAGKDPLCPVLYDDRELQFARLTPRDLIEIETIHREYAASLSFCKIAILVADGLPREIAERWARLASSTMQARFKVFTEESPAREWLAGT